MKKTNILSLIIMIIIVIGIIVSIVIYKNNLKSKLSFTKENYEYMYNDICKSFGNGEKFHVEKITEKYLNETLISVEGKKVSIIGYFDSEENMYTVVYAKYLKDRPAYKNGKAGDVLFVTVNNNYSKEEYFNSNKNV